jgi:hypothetical protein
MVKKSNDIAPHIHSKKRVACSGNKEVLYLSFVHVDELILGIPCCWYALSMAPQYNVALNRNTKQN